MFKARTYLFIISLLIFLVGEKLSFAQGTQVSFGQNRVQYHDFDWLSYESENFITYYYPGGQELGKFVVIAAEDRVKHLEERLNYALSSKIEILVYNDITDLAQTNIGITEGTYNTGGTNYSEGTKLFLYYDGDHSNMLKMLEKGLAEIYLNSMMAGGNFAEVIQNAVFLNLPSWYVSGLAAFIGEDWNTEYDNKLRRYWNESPKASFHKLSQEDAEFAGHALWHFIFERYGSSAIQNILYLTRINRSVNKGFVFGVGKSFEDVIEDWEVYYQFHAAKDTVNRQSLPDEDILRTKLKKKQGITQLIIAPDGRNIAYAVHKGGSFRVFTQNIETGKKRRIFDGGFKSDNYPHDNSYPLLTWSPSGTTLIGVHEKRDQVKLVEWDVLSRKKRKDDIRNFQRLYHISFAPDGKRLVLSAQNKGQTDIYTYDLSTTRTVQLTNDIFDDLEPVMMRIGGVNGVFFSSNRPDEQIRNATLDSILPVGKFNLYFLNTENQEAPLVKITDDYFGYKHAASVFSQDEFAYLSDENGISNLYKGRLDSMILRVDTLYNEGDRYALDTIYSFSATTRPVTDFPTDVKWMSVAPKVNKWVYAVEGKRKAVIYLSKIPAEELPLRLENTAYRNTWNALQKKDLVVKRTERVTQGEVQALKDLDTLIDQQFTFTFETRYNYSLPTSKEKAARSQVVQDSLSQADETYQAVENKDDQPVIQFRSGRSIPYRAKFSSNYLTTQLDNSVLPFTYQSYSLNGARFNYPNLSGMIMFGTQDLMEDHKIVGGFRIPGNFRGTEVFVSYENLKKRLDKRLLFYRRSNQENYTLLVNNTYTLPVIGKQKTNYIETRLSYPFDVTKSLRLYAGYRNDRLLLGYTDSITRVADIDVNENWSFLKLEFVHDNSKEIQENIYSGFRYKFYSEYFRNWSEKKSNLFTVGFDVRHYTTIYKNFIWANRIAGATSFGQRKVVYYLGGVDTWLNQKFDNSIPVSTTANYAFQAQATNVRGFPMNIRNGNSYMVLNSELRFPVFSFLSKKPIKSAFIRNMQVVGFFDVGSAYKGLTPFNEDNPYTNEQVTPGSGQTPVVVNVDYYRNPTIMGVGGGLRTTLLGYFIRVDFAWGIDGGIVNKKPQWLFSLSKDF